MQEGRTPLIVATTRALSSVVERLITARVDVNAATKVTGCISEFEPPAPLSELQRGRPVPCRHYAGRPPSPHRPAPLCQSTITMRTSPTASNPPLSHD